MELNRRRLLRTVAAAAFVTGAVLVILGLAVVSGLAPSSGQPDQSSTLEETTPAREKRSGRPLFGNLWGGFRVDPSWVPTTSSGSEVVADNSALPTRLVIDAIGVDASIITLGMNSALVPEVPSTSAEVAWYDFSAKPGAGSNVVLSGHITWDRATAVFWELGELEEGDLIYLATDAGDQLVYEVTANLLVDPGEPESVRLIYPTDTEMLTLITCGGTFNADPGAPNGGEYSHRSIVQAMPVS